MLYTGILSQIIVIFGTDPAIADTYTNVASAKMVYDYWTATYDHHMVAIMEWDCAWPWPASSNNGWLALNYRVQHLTNYERYVRVISLDIRMFFVAHAADCSK